MSELKTHEQVIESMNNAWFSKWRWPGSVRSRPAEYQNWDSAILAAAEYIRRRAGNEDLAFQMHGMLSTKLPVEQTKD